MDKVLIAALVVCIVLLSQYVWQQAHAPGVPTLTPEYLDAIGAPQELDEHTLEFQEKEVIKVKDGIYVAVNFGISNSIMLIGPSGVVIVDTLESLTAAKEVAAEFRNITDKETKAIIYTHHHTDHIMGSQAFINEGQDPQIWAHHQFPAQQQKVFNTRKASRVRARQQLGFDVTDGFLNAGIGGRSRFEEGMRNLPPTHFVPEDEDSEINVAGLRLQLLYMPGETSDQISVWMPDERVLMVGDNIYKAFPNLYAIRGSQPRDVNRWSQTLDKMRKLRPECIIGSHAKPLCGEDEVYALLSDYMYGIQYVHDQTVRFINQGMHPEEIAHRVKLPPELARQPYLGQFYGNVPWSVKGVYISYLGWFSGYAEDLNPLTPTDRAQKMVELVGKDELLSAAESALNKGDNQWALELATHVYKTDQNNAKALLLRRQAMAELAATQMSANGRNFYLTAMLKDAGELENRKVEVAALKLPVNKIFQSMRMKLKAEDIPEGERLAGCFEITDSKQTICATIHKGIMEIDDHEISDYSFKMTVTENVFKNIIGGVISAGDSSARFDVGGLAKFEQFMNYIEK